MYSQHIKSWTVFCDKVSFQFDFLNLYEVNFNYILCVILIIVQILFICVTGYASWTGKCGYYITLHWPYQNTRVFLMIFITWYRPDALRRQLPSCCLKSSTRNFPIKVPFLFQKRNIRLFDNIEKFSQMVVTNYFMLLLLLLL